MATTTNLAPGENWTGIDAFAGSTAADRARNFMRARRHTRMVRALRWSLPTAGASVIVVYFLMKTPLIPLEESALTLPLFVVVAFLAGFSERWTRMVLSGAMRTVGAREPEPEDDAPPEPAATAAS